MNVSKVTRACVCFPCGRCSVEPSSLWWVRALCLVNVSGECGECPVEGDSFLRASTGKRVCGGGCWSGSQRSVALEAGIVYTRCSCHSRLDNQVISNFRSFHARLSSQSFFLYRVKKGVFCRLGVSGIWGTPYSSRTMPRATGVHCLSASSKTTVGTV